MMKPGTTRMQAATAEILKTAKLVTTPGFANLNKSIDPNQEQEQEETIVAVIGKTMIPVWRTCSTDHAVSGETVPGGFEQLPHGSAR